VGFVEARVPSGILVRVVMPPSLDINCCAHQLGITCSDSVLQLSASGRNSDDQNVVRCVRGGISYRGNLSGARRSRVHPPDGYSLSGRGLSRSGIEVQTLLAWAPLTRSVGCERPVNAFTVWERERPWVLADLEERGILKPGGVA